MKKTILYTLILSLISVFSFAQEEATEAAQEKDYPVSAVFESGTLIDNQTTVIPDAKTLEMVIQHKFSSIDKGLSNIWGIYGSANIRLALNYVPVKNVQIGAGLTRKYMTTDLNAKWTVLQQTRKNTIPVSVALYGNIGIDGRNVADFESDQVREAYSGPVSTYDFQDRLSYFSQLIVSRKFNDRISLQAGASFSHYNAVSEGFDHDKIGVHANGRIKVSNQGSIMFSYDHPLRIKQMSEQLTWANASEPTYSLGYEVSTGTHAFQIYMASTTSILPQDNMLFNRNEFKAEGISFGFVITRLWGF